MNTTDREWIDAIRHRKPVSARWGYPHDLSSVRAEGRAIGYSATPMVLIQTDDGEQFWWGAELTFIDEPEGDL